MKSKVIAALAMSASVAVTPYASAFAINDNIAPYVQSVKCSSAEGVFNQIVKEIDYVGNVPIVKEALELFGDIVELSDGQAEYYHDSILKHSEILKGSIIG